MSIRFDGNIANYLSRTASVPNYNSPYTVMGWLKWKVDNEATQAAFALSSASASNSFDFFGPLGSSDVSVLSTRLTDGIIESDSGSAMSLDVWVHWAVVRNSTTDCRLYIDLVEDAQTTLDIFTRTANDICTIGRLTVNGSGFIPLDAETAYYRIWTTNLTPSEIAADRLSTTAVKTASLFGDYPMVNAASAGNDISGNGNHFTVNGTILTGASEPPLSAGPSLFRGRGFSFFDDEEVNRFEFWPVVGGAVDLVVQDATHAHTADSPTLTQQHELVVQSATHAHASENVVVTQVHALQVDDAVHSHAAENVIVTQVHALTVQDAVHDHSAENVVVTQAHELTVENATHAHSAENVAVTQQHSLTVDSATHAHEAENVVITQVHTLVVQSAEHAHTAENVTATQVHELSIDDTVHAHTADNVAVDQAVQLVVQDAVHDHTADSLVLTQAHGLAVDDTTHAHTAETPALTQTHVLAVQNSAHAHATENVTLEQGVQLVVDDAVHAHSAANVILTQLHQLVVASTTHAHTASNVTVTSGQIATPPRRTFVVQSANRIFTVKRKDREYVVIEPDRVEVV